jgi:hypothetical protein
MLSSCTKDFRDVNTDPNNTPNALPSQLLAPALVSTLTYNMLRNRNFNNELMQVTVDVGDGDGKVFRYDYRSTWSDYLYNGWYSELTNFKDIYNIASQELNYSRAYMGISLICQSWIYSLLTDTYGDVPYSESNKAKPENGGIIEPAFDRQKDIYLDIFNKLEQADTLLATAGSIATTADPVYGGNVSYWRKFGNSLYLRLLLRISGKSEVAPTVIAKIKQIVETPSLYPIFASTDESAILKWTGVAPYTSPFLGVREQDFRAPGIAEFFMEHLVWWNDPRIDLTTYATNGICRWRIATYSGAFLGIPSGYAAGEVQAKKSYFYSNGQTVNGATPPNLMTEPLTGMMMNYAELKFILAEAAAKGWITGSAQTYYNDGVYASIRQWIPTWAGSVTDYLTAADQAWNEADSLGMKMEKIHLQKYYALFCTDLQQWFEYRRTGHPVLPKGTGLRNNGIMPARMTYPVYVQSTNPTNYKAAVAAQGPDDISTPVWWQKP